MRSPRVRPSIRRFAVWILPVLLLIAAWQLWDAVEGRRVEREIAPVLARRSLPESTPPPGVDNAGRYYAAAAIAAVDRNQEWQIQLEPGGARVDVLQALRDSLSAGATPPQLLIDAARRQISRDAVVLDLVARAGAFEHYRFEPGTEFTLQTSGLIGVYRTAALRTLELVVERDGDAAASLLLDRVRLLRAVSRSPGFFVDAWKISFVRQLAADIGLVLQAEPSDERLAQLDRAFAGIYGRDDLEDSISREILSRYDAVHSMWQGRRSSVFGLMMRPFIQHQFVGVLQTANGAIEAARLPWPDRIAALERIPDRRFLGPDVLQFVGLWAATEFPVRFAESVAAARCSRLAVRVAEFSRERGRLPQSLTEMAPLPDDEDASDPFTGRPLLYTRGNGGFAIYSVGSNRQDDGGTLSPDPASGQPGWRPSPDVGVRVVSRQQAVVGGSGTRLEPVVR